MICRKLLTLSNPILLCEADVDGKVWNIELEHLTKVYSESECGVLQGSVFSILIIEALREQRAIHETYTGAFSHGDDICTAIATP